MLQRFVDGLRSINSRRLKTVSSRNNGDPDSAFHPDMLFRVRQAARQSCPWRPIEKGNFSLSGDMLHRDRDRATEIFFRVQRSCKIARIPKIGMCNSYRSLVKKAVLNRMANYAL
jgi:hypothetical protein